MKTEEIVSLVMAEVSRAENIHPNWPEDIVRAVSCVAEEAGELVQAVNNYDEDPSSSRYPIITEAVQTAAVAIRFLKNFKEEK